MTTYKIIVNPVAGRGDGLQSIPKVEALLGDHGLVFDLVRTERPWHAADLAQEAAAAGYGTVIAVGGDGTANEVLNGLMRAKLAGDGTSAMGVLCVGRGNDFAFGAGIPTTLEEGCQVLARDQRRLIDVGRVVGGLYPEGRFFGNGIGIGFDAVVGFEAAKMTWLHGFPSYIVGVFKTVFLYYNPPLTRIEYGGETITQRSLMVSVMNGRRMGGGFMMAPEGHPGDGQLDLCIAGDVSRAGVFRLIPHFMKGTQAGQEPVRTSRAQSVTITAVEGVLPAHADGETLCTDGQRLEAEILPAQLEVLTSTPDP
jgi:YegS/Rv2252/BmrU family lipid kinase